MCRADGDLPKAGSLYATHFRFLFALKTWCCFCLQRNKVWERSRVINTTSDHLHLEIIYNMGVPCFDVTYTTFPRPSCCCRYYSNACFFFFFTFPFLCVPWQSGWETLMSSTLAQRDGGACRPSGCHDLCPCVIVPCRW